MDYTLNLVDQQGQPIRIREASTRIFEVTLDLSKPVSGGLVPINSLQRVHAFTVKNLLGGAVLRMGVGQGGGSFKVGTGETRDNLSVDQLSYFSDGGVGWQAVIEIQGR